MEKLQVQVLKAKQLEPSGLLAYMLLIVLAVAVGLHLLQASLAFKTLKGAFKGRQ